MNVRKASLTTPASLTAPQAEQPSATKASAKEPGTASKASKKAIGAETPSARAAKPSLYKLTDAQSAKVLGNTALAAQCNIYHATTSEKSLAKAFTASIAMIGQQQAGDPDSMTSLHVDTLTKATRDEVFQALNQGASETETGGGMYQKYAPKEVGALLHYLDAVAGKGAQLYMATWSDISSEFLGSMIAVQSPSTKQLTFVQVITELP